MKKLISNTKQSKDFVCANCGKIVKFVAPGTHHRNHCPYCLCSVHVDNRIGDRRSNCGGKMPSIGKYYKKDGEEVLVQKCEKCGYVRANRVAGDDSFSLVENLQVVTIEDVQGV